jgi:transposase-like protein
VADFRERPLDAGPYTFVAFDALTMKVREGGPVAMQLQVNRLVSDTRSDATSI